MRTATPLAVAALRLIRHRLFVLAVLASLAAGLALVTTSRAQSSLSACANGNTALYFGSLPNGGTLSTQPGCSTCHSNSGTGARNVFGNAYASRPQVANAGGFYHQWDTTLAAQDRDTNGVNNGWTGYTYGERLQDPTGTHTGAFGNASRVVDPNSDNLPPAPVLQSVGGVTAGGSYQGTVGLSVAMDTLIGARKVTYDIMSGATVAKSYATQTSATPYGGYTSTVATFNLTWDTNDVPNGTYSVRVTLADGRAARLGGARTSQLTVANVTINNPARTVRYIAPGGSDSGTCASSGAPCATLAYAVGQAANNDELRLAAGTYPTGGGGAPLTVGVRVSIRGGYTTSSWATPDPVANVTVLDGQHAHPVLAFTAAADGFSVQGLTVSNGAGATGAGVSVSGADGTFSGVSFSGNQASANGGALALDAASSATLSGVRFGANQATGKGGAIYALGPVTIANALFVGNSATSAAAIDLEGGAGHQVNYATIAGSASPADALLVAGTAGSVLLRDVLVSGYATGLRQSGGSSAVTLQSTLMANDGANNVATAVNRTAGTISGAPARGAAGYASSATGDFRLAFGAPAVDAGVAVPGVSADLDGQLRPTGAAPDIGAYEFHGAQGAVSFSMVSINTAQPAPSVDIVVTLSIPSVTPLSVHYDTIDDTAVAGTDYIAKSGDLTFAPGETSKTITVSLLSPPATTLRTFLVVLSNLSKGVPGEYMTASVTIAPPPDPPRISVAASAPSANRTGPAPGAFTISRDIGADLPLTVHYTVGGTAAAGVDYATLSGTAVIPAGAYEATVWVRPVGGSGLRYVTLTLSPDKSYLLGRTSAVVQIDGVLSWRQNLPLTVR